MNLKNINKIKNAGSKNKKVNFKFVLKFITEKKKLLSMLKEYK